jgi:hypothetical protein
MSQAIKIAAKEALARREDADELDVLPAESTAE